MAKAAPTQRVMPAPEAPMGRVIDERLRVDRPQSTLDTARRRLMNRVCSLLDEAGQTGEVGMLADVVADLRALDEMVSARAEPVRPVVKADPELDERRAAAADDAKMQAYNRKVADKERGETVED